jgi:hypothetical protein
MSWQSAGAFVWHEADVDPTVLGMTMRTNGFGWVAIRIHDGVESDPVAGRWIERFRAASGLPVGGWGVLRDRPEDEARLASSRVDHLRLAFYVANAEAEYSYTGPDGPSEERSGRSQRFVRAFRELQPSLPAGLSSYCRPDLHDLDWDAWRAAGLVFLPQAYVNQLGAGVAPTQCVQGAAHDFTREQVHPTIGTFRGAVELPSPEQYAGMLDEAGTIGFSLYLAETTPEESWRAFGTAITASGIAR